MKRPRAELPSVYVFILKLETIPEIGGVDLLAGNDLQCRNRRRLTKNEAVGRADEAQFRRLVHVFSPPSVWHSLKEPAYCASFRLSWSASVRKRGSARPACLGSDCREPEFEFAPELQASGF